MKADKTTGNPSPRRRWLGGLAAAAGAALAWKGTARHGAVASGSAPSEGKPAPASPARPPLVVRPAPDSVKRHG